MKKLYCTLILSVACMSLFALSACGIKPEDVDPPVSVQNDSFPNVYPDVSTDPKL